MYTNFIFFFKEEDGIRDLTVTGVQTCALPILPFLSVARDQSLNQRHQLAGRLKPPTLALLDDRPRQPPGLRLRSEEHTSELQSQSNLVCRLLLEKKKKTKPTSNHARTTHYHTL